MKQYRTSEMVDMIFLGSAILCGITGVMTWTEFPGITDSSTWNILTSVVSPLNFLAGTIMIVGAGLHIFLHRDAMGTVHRRHTYERNG